MVTGFIPPPEQAPEYGEGAVPKDGGLLLAIQLVV